MTCELKTSQFHGETIFFSSRAQPEPTSFFWANKILQRLEYIHTYLQFNITVGDSGTECLWIWGHCSRKLYKGGESMLKTKGFYTETLYNRDSFPKEFKMLYNKKAENDFKVHILICGHGSSLEIKNPSSFLEICQK